ncbi:hypothetical protein OSTOST_11978, partial [Ostertagia ostertagi]
PSPGLANHCEGENFRSYLPRIELPFTTTQSTTTEEPFVEEFLLPDEEDEGLPQRGILVNQMEAVKRGQSLCSKQVLDLKHTISALTAKVEAMESQLRFHREEMKRQSSLTYAAQQWNTEQEERKFGIHRSNREKAKFASMLRHVEIDGKRLNAKQITELASYSWLLYYKDQSRPDSDFMRCSLCNREVTDYDPEPDFAKCAPSTNGSSDGYRKNILGKNEVMCLKRYAGRSSAGRSITALMRRIKEHQFSKVHSAGDSAFRSSLMEGSSNAAKNVEATISAALAAYTIAKEGLSLEMQLPLLLMEMRAGAIPTTAHYSSQSAGNMITTFARHMKYDMLKYLINSKLPFSLLADGTSHDGKKWIIFLLRTVSPQNRPITFHLALVSVTSEKAVDIVNVFTEHLRSLSKWKETPGLEEEPYMFAMKRMIALSSDGASVMEGKHGGVHAKLKDLIRRETRNSVRREEFLLSVCAAHKLNLAVQAQRGLAFNLTRTLITEMHHLLGSTVATRAHAIYSRTAEGMGFRALRMDPIHAVRWSASLQNSLSKILRMYPVLIAALGKLTADGSVPKAMRDRAQGAAYVMTDSHTFIILHHEQREEEFLLSVCAAHKLNLAVQAQRGLAFNLTRTLITEMHHLLGSTVATRAHAIYSRTAEGMGFRALRMDPIHAVRWSASLQNSLSKILRMYPVLIAALGKLTADGSVPKAMRDRAQGAAYVMTDSHTFIILHHVNATLSYLARLSEALQQEEALLVDFLSVWRHIDSLLKHDTIKNEVYENLAASGILTLHDSESDEYHEVDSKSLKSYHCFTEEHNQPSRGLLFYDPTTFPDYQSSRVGHLTADQRRESAPLRRIQKFRPFEDLQSLSSHFLGGDDVREDEFDVSMLHSIALGKTYFKIVNARQSEDTINTLYEHVRQSLRNYMAPEKRPTEAVASFPYALDRHTILDMIDCNGDYDSFKDCVLPGTSAANRGYPVFIDSEGNVDKIKRQKAISDSIDAIAKVCSLPRLNKFFMDFYNTIAGAVRALNTWPTDFREDKTSIRFYQTLLNHGDALKIPDPVREAIKCILVIPASNADPERSFSQANRLTRRERSNLGDDTLDSLMMSDFLAL